MDSIRLAVTPESVSCAVTVRNGAIDNLGAELGSLSSSIQSAVVLVTDETVASLYLDRVVEGLRSAGSPPHVITIPPGESSKSFQQLAAIHEFLGANRVARDGVILAVGGGVITDLAGFAAATWMRGIDWVAVPTTLEGQIDAAIGGKTAINIRGGKNLVGAFHLPRAVVIDPTCLGTLDPRDIRAGLAESIKHALISSEEFFVWHEQNVEAILALDESVVAKLVSRNVKIKAGVVTRDPFERTGERMTLNFGHTMGHAIEACCGYALRHGECVGLGMLTACRMSCAMGMLDQGVVDRVKALLERYGLPTTLTGDVRSVPFERIMKTIMRDKKARGKQVQWVLLESIGKTCATTGVEDKIVCDAYGSLV